MRPKRVVYTVIDGVNRDVFEQVTDAGRAPALAFLREAGRYRRDLVATFPTITPAATATLLTGEPPSRHGIPGMCWYDRAAQRFVNYGQSPRAAVVEGVGQVVRDFLTNLNCTHLSSSVSTLHETLGGLGFSTASVNYMIFRGPHHHELKANVLQRLLFNKHLPDSLPGPKEHYFADVVSGPADACSKLLSGRGVAKRMRATDGWAACVTRELLEKNETDLILFYLHENDHTSHQKGPAAQAESLVEADGHIAHVLDAFGSWERAVEEVGWVVVSDHSQSPVEDDDDHVLDLNDLLGDFSRVGSGRGKEPFGDNDVACAGNGRVGFVYLNDSNKERLLPRVAAALLSHPGVDQVLWRAGDAYVVDTTRGRLSFRIAESEGVVDGKGNKWMVDGELGAVDGFTEGNELMTPTYPLALCRIKDALDLDRSGDLVVTVKLGYELKDLAGAHHRGGGDHASLHAQDSIVPFISTLGNPPERPTSADVVPHILEHFRRT